MYEATGPDHSEPIYDNTVLVEDRCCEKPSVAEGYLKHPKVGKMMAKYLY